MVYLFCAFLGTGVLAAICVPLFRKDNSLESAIIEETEWDLLQRKKEILLGNIQDLDFEFKCGKLSDTDYAQVRGEMTADVAVVLEHIDSLEKSLDLDVLIRRETDAPKRRIKAKNPDVLRNVRGKKSSFKQVLFGMWNQTESFMNMRNQSRFHAVCWTALWFFCGSSLLLAQDDTAPHSAEVPNPMGIHTWFIILVVGAFLAWSISYSLQLQKEALKRRTSREGLLLRKNQYLDEIAELETQKEAGKISEQRFNRQFNNTKLRLAKVLAQIEENRDTQL